MDTTTSKKTMLKLAEQLRQELNDDRLRDEQGHPLRAVLDPLPAVEFIDGQRNRLALLEEAPGSRWLLQFFDKTGRLLATRSGRLPHA